MDKPSDSSEPRRFGNFSYLLGSLLALLIGASFTGTDRVSVTIFCLLFSVVLLTAVVSACHRHKTLSVGIALVIAMLSLNATGYLFESQSVFIVHNVLVIAFFTFASYHVLCAVLYDREVTLDTIVGAVCLYLLAGLVWTYLYSTVLLLDTSAFRMQTVTEATGASPFGNVGFQALVYLSFVTMTTLGYGDITPVSNPARTACFLQAVFGQFFLAVLVARLVALYIAAATSSQKDPH